jgi:hypothetical protein
MTKGDSDAIAVLKKKAVPSIVAAALIIIVPTAVNLVVSLFTDTLSYSKCLVNATPDGIDLAYEDKMEKLISRVEETLSESDYNIALTYLKKIKDESKKEAYQKRLDAVYELIAKMKIKSIVMNDTVVEIDVRTGKSTVAGYYFSSIEKIPELDAYDWIDTNESYFKVVKYPGTYYVYVKDSEGNIIGGDKVEVPEVFDVTLMHKDKKMMPVSISTYLERHNSSLDAFNIKMSSYNRDHEYRTRESVVVGAMAFVGEIQSWGYYMPYGGGNYTIEKDAWGVYKYWGGGESTFLACNPFVVWAFKQAGLNIYGDRSKIRSKLTTHQRLNKEGETLYELVVKPPQYDNEVHIYNYFVGVLASTDSYGDNIIDRKKGRSGDILQNGAQSGHEMLIVDKYDEDMDGISDGYIVLQSRDIGVCYEKIPFGHTTVYDMTNVYNNSAKFKDYLYGWNDYFIPTNDYPNWM